AQNIDSSLTQNRAFCAVAFEFCHIMHSHPQPSLWGVGRENLMNHPFKNSVTPHVSDRWLPSGDCAERSRTSLHKNLSRRADTTCLPYALPRHTNAVHSVG
ncbi:unnamed protein product, partial [Sphacelaria rigidula]